MEFHEEYGNFIPFSGCKEFIFRSADSNFQKKMKIYDRGRELTARIVEDIKFLAKNSYFQN